MVLISSTKYACETCIKGHRSSTCKHTDRPLFEIKKKGRPVTQCEHCRELRKTKQVHVKCLCELKDLGAPSVPSKKKGNNNPISESAAFPDGLPQALEVSVALQNISEGTSSDSDPGVECECKSGAECHCCTPRKVRTKPRKPPSAASVADAPAPAEMSSHVLARVAELRPVLPRPESQSHIPSSSTVHGHAGRQPHEDVLYNPYKGAFDYTHAHGYSQPPSPPLSSYGQSFPNLFDTLTVPPRSFPSLCGCGDTCSCAGCTDHTAPPSSTCSNPGACSACLDCLALSLPASLPPNAPMSASDLYEQTQYIDEWIRQISALPNTTESTSFEYDIGMGPTYSNAWEVPGGSNDYEASRDCICPPGLCQCDREYNSNSPSNNGGSNLTFGEEAPCSCYSARQQQQPSQSTDTGYLSVPIPGFNRSRSSSESNASGNPYEGYMSTSRLDGAHSTTATRRSS